MAEGRDMLDDLEREITCAICHDHYTEPKVLPCCHYYCKQCLHRLALRTGLDRPFSCPECRKDAILPQASANNLPAAFFVNCMKEMHSRLERAHGKVEAKCEICVGGRKAEAFCRQCAQFLCAECVSHHPMMRMFTGHKIASFEELKKGGAEPNILKEASLQTCALHEQPKSIFCFDCNTLICPHCTIKPHNNHNYEFIKVAAPEAKKKLIQQLEPLKEAKETFSHAVKAVQTTKSEVEAQGKFVEQSIQSSMDELIQIIQHRRQELMTEARERATQKLDCLSGQEERLSTACATMQSVVEYTERCVEHSADDEVMCMHTELQSRIGSEIEQSKKEKNLEPMLEVDMGVEVSCVQDLKLLCQNKARLTSFIIATLTGEGMKMAKVNQASEIRLVTKLSNGTPTKQSCIIECSLKSLVDGTTIKCKVSRVQTNAYNICYTPTVRGRHELTVTVNGHDVAGSPFSVHVSIHPTQLSKPARVIHEGDSPRDVAVNSAGEVVVVTSGGDIMVYYALAQHRRRLRSCKASDYNMSTLRGVTVDSSNDHMFITGNVKGDNVNFHKIICLSPDLKLRNEVSIDGSLQYFTGLTIVGKEVMIPDSKYSSIMVYTTELKYVKQIGSSGSGPGQFSNIRDVSSDEHGNLYISDRGKACIYVYSQGGDFVRSLSSKNNKLKCPLGVCVSGQHVYVTDNSNHNITVFTTEGEYVTSFGQYGAKKGDLIRPIGVCIDKDGFVYVCDNGNTRLQIF